MGTFLILVFLLVGGSKALAAETHTFDPTLSLTGGECIESSLDPVPDPGCAESPRPPVFNSPRDVATDAYGDIYVASYGRESEAVNGKEGRIDIFNPQGFFISELKEEVGPKNLALDSQGNLYVYHFHPSTFTSESVAQVVRYTPSVYKPEAGEIEYGGSPSLVQENGNSMAAMTINRANDHLFVNNGHHVSEYGSAAEENKLLDESLGEGILNNNSISTGLAVDAARNRVYVNNDHKVDVFDLNPPHALIGTIERSATPDGGEFEIATSIAVDESTGHVFVFDGLGTGDVYEFTKDGGYVSTIKHSFNHVIGSQIAVDNGSHSPNGGLNSKGRYLYVPSQNNTVGHSFAFGPALQSAPVILSASAGEVTEAEASLEAEINPEGAATAYTFEYTTQRRFEEEGDSFTGATVAGGGEIAAGGAAVPVAVAAKGLEAGIAYRFRVRASNEKGADKAEGSFSTYPAENAEPAPCSNKSLRAGASASLPDCRAYELVTPPDTNARSPLGVGYLGTYFATREASPQGGAVSFQIEGGSIPGSEATGSYAGDPYLSTRTEGGWSTEYAGPTGSEAPALLPGSNSPDPGYFFWSTASAAGSAAVGGTGTTYLRYPDGHSALVGRGSSGTDPNALGRLISESGAHVVFTSKQPLEEGSPAEGTEAIYDRTIDPVSGAEETHLVSLLPGGATPSQDAHYQGASLDGKGIAFLIDNKLYLRYEDEETFEIGEGVTFAGVAEGGARIFYLEGGDLFAFDAEGEKIIRFTEAGNVTPVNVAAEGTAAYFVSPSVLSEEESPTGAKAQEGGENLYLSREGQISFVGTVTKRDVGREEPGNGRIDGLGLWTRAVSPPGPGRFGVDPSRTTPDGNALLFESRASLGAYSSEGHPEIYRYDFVDHALDCISCNPTQAAPTGQASLESVAEEQGAPEPFGPYALVNNLRPDGRRAFFQSTEALVPRDVDKLQDVYEWEDQGVGSCSRPGGCVYLISSGESDRTNYLYAVSDSGNDVFFRTSDLLTNSDVDETPSIYDARVGGGFPEPNAAACQEEGCHPAPLPPPAMTAPQTPVLGKLSNPPSKRCPKGKRRAKRNGKTVCVEKKHKHGHRRHKTSKRAGAGETR
ncbi:MAG: hypothetical protein ACTHNP_03410 [Solirubrobacterales bacterium]